MRACVVLPTCENLHVQGENRYLSISTMADTLFLFDILVLKLVHLLWVVSEDAFVPLNPQSCSIACGHSVLCVVWSVEFVD